MIHEKELIGLGVIKLNAENGIRSKLATEKI